MSIEIAIQENTAAVKELTRLLSAASVSLVPPVVEEKSKVKAATKKAEEPAAEGKPAIEYEALKKHFMPYATSNPDAARALLSSFDHKNGEGAKAARLPDIHPDDFQTVWNVVSEGLTSNA